MGFLRADFYKTRLQIQMHIDLRVNIRPCHALRHFKYNMAKDIGVRKTWDEIKVF